MYCPTRLAFFSPLQLIDHSLLTGFRLSHNTLAGDMGLENSDWISVSICRKENSIDQGGCCPKDKNKQKKVLTE